MRLIRIAFTVAALALLASCHAAPVSGGARPAAGPWRTLFDGSSLDAWRGYKGAPIPAGWHIAGNTLAKDVPVADIVTKGRVRRLRARARVEDRRGRQQRHLLPRHRGVRPHLLERPRVPAARRHQGRRTTRRGSPAPARRTASIRRPRDTSSRSASGTRRASSRRARTSSTGSTASSCSSTSSGAPTGRRR